MADRNNALIVGFDRTAAHPIGQNTKGTLMYAGVDGNPTSVLNPSKTKFAPRIGAAWTMNDKMAIRAGYGLYWAPPSYAGFNTLGYTQISQFLGTIDGGRTPNGSLANPFPTGLVKPVGNPDGKNAGTGQWISFPDQFATSPRMHQFSFDVQRILPVDQSRRLCRRACVHVRQRAAGGRLPHAWTGQRRLLTVQDVHYLRTAEGAVPRRSPERAQYAHVWPPGYELQHGQLRQSY